MSSKHEVDANPSPTLTTHLPRRPNGHSPSQLLMVILNEKQLERLSTATDDAPPSYYHLEPGSSNSIRSQNRQPPPIHPHRSTPTSSPSSSPSQLSRSSPTFTALVEAKLESKKSKLKSSLLDLLGGGTAKTIKDVKNMAYRSVRDVVKHPGAQQSTALIEACAGMCRAKGVNFSEILQDPFLEGHRALYWVIISRPPPDEYELLSAILKHSGPLSSEAIDEVRLVCLQVGDQTLFNHLWRHPAYGALSGTDELLLGATAPVDYVEVQETTADEIGAFTARFEITQFHKRMNVSGKIVFEFIARGRLWCLKFYATPDKKTSVLGPWAISLSIINPSPPTWLDSRIIITESRRKSSALLPPWPLPKGSAMASLLSASSLDLRREKPPIQFRLQTKSHQLQPPTSAKTKVGRSELVARFMENAASSGLQYPDSVYYSPNGTLRVIMEGRLAEPLTGADCIIS
ncbi:hypothetical protein BDM02DRAFT_2512491 [Thelephora ganbajun]|uniref:Uncharacterized protein n=1 Tax=Thelephora ganbajun TaxID=370292 RepID=A0ACB6ZDK1_THEGA|nr:hypothetical protein BDM02DRAFT_2512491 [Thelephora ganbajun]